MGISHPFLSLPFSLSFLLFSLCSHHNSPLCPPFFSPLFCFHSPLFFFLLFYSLPSLNSSLITFPLLITPPSKLKLKTSPLTLPHVQAQQTPLALDHHRLLRPHHKASLAQHQVFQHYQRQTPPLRYPATPPRSPLLRPRRNPQHPAPLRIHIRSILGRYHLKTWRPTRTRSQA